MTRVRIIGSGMTAQAVAAYCRDRQYTCTDQNPEYVIMSPGIRPDSVSGGPKLSEVEFAYREWGDKRPFLIGVTGTNGKSTVASLIAHLLACPVIGNIGDPVIRYVTQSHPILVCELSSFQLELCDLFRCDIAVMLGLDPDHLDRHGTMAAYAAAKSRLWHRQTPQDHLVYNADLPIDFSTGLGQRHPIHSTTITTPVPPWQPGRHLALQISWRVAQLAQVPESVLRKRYKTFNGLPHRLQHVGCYAGVDWYNDSKATNPSAVIAAIQALRSKRLILILAGIPKPVSYADLIACINRHVACVIHTGPMPVSGITVPTYAAQTLNLAVMQARALAKPKACVLLSPGGSSFDAFESFADRGNAYTSYIKAAH